MPTIIVEVMPKAELLDPQGKAIIAALRRLGPDGFSAANDVTSVRVGKRFEIALDVPVDSTVHAEVKKLAGDLLSNSVIEDVAGIWLADNEGKRIESFFPPSDG